MPGRPLNILTVDDSAGIRYLLSTVVCEEGHNSYLASNGLEALEIVKNIKPHLIFMDLKMPAMDGLTFLQKIKELSYIPEVIVMTVFTEKEVVEQVYQYGARKCLEKPFDLNEIRNLIRAAAKVSSG